MLNAIVFASAMAIIVGSADNGTTTMDDRLAMHEASSMGLDVAGNGEEWSGKVDGGAVILTIKLVAHSRPAPSSCNHQIDYSSPRSPHWAALRLQSVVRVP